MEKKFKNVLVTGATGKIGSRLTPRLIRWGYQVRVLALEEEIEKISSLKSLGAEAVIGNILNPEAVRTVLKDIGIVIHLASLSPVAEEEDMRKVNLSAAEIIARTSVEAGVKHFIFASSNRVYGTQRGKQVTENDKIEPAKNKFAISKMEVEDLLTRLFKNTDITLCIFRFALVYGDGDSHLMQTINELIEWAPAKRLQMVHHADIAQAMKLSISQRAHGIYNLTDDAPLTISELRELFKLPDTLDAPVSDLWDMIASNLKIREELGFRPVFPTFYSARDAGAL
jgi:nucleoside-diphosphate-sugar epimerase